MKIQVYLLVSAITLATVTMGCADKSETPLTTLGTMELARYDPRNKQNDQQVEDQLQGEQRPTEAQLT